MLDWQNITTWSILLVDDEPDNLEVLAESLEFYGILVKTAQNGLDGLDVLKDFTPTLILTDLSMPKMDGWEMRLRVKNDPRIQHLPVVALSAHAIAGDKERAMEVGFDGYLTKPVNVPTLIHDLKAALQESFRPLLQVQENIPSPASVIPPVAVEPISAVEQIVIAAPEPSQTLLPAVAEVTAASLSSDAVQTAPETPLSQERSVK